MGELLVSGPSSAVVTGDSHKKLRRLFRVIGLVQEINTTRVPKAILFIG
ncbi:MAG: hypothetical protein CM1200mP18_18190 [Gammaproteobacteria bacterium]|nr:MAG: hypothetical protein CM1200mP18_18190 [Gammaproteobacteria bacterium]